MRVLLISRLMTGFENCLEDGVWAPKGSVAMARVIERLSEDTSVNLKLIMTRALTTEDSLIVKRGWHGRTIHVRGLSSAIDVLAVKPWFWLPSRLRFLWGEFCHLLSIFMKIHHFKPDVIYLERSNWLIGGVLARITHLPVFMRLLGVPPDMWSIGENNALFHVVMRWAFRAPFAHVLCTEDGSSGREWMNQFLARDVTRSILLNGVVLDNQHPSINEAIETPVQVVFLGRIEDLKGSDFFVEALIGLSKDQRDLISPIMVGDGTLLPKLKKKVEKVGLADWLHFSGSISATGVGDVLKGAGLYVSLNVQGHISNASLEAVSFGVPFLIRELSGEKDLSGGLVNILGSEAYMSVKADISPAEFANVLAELCADKNLLMTMRREVCAARDRHLVSWEKRINEEISLLSELVTQGGRE